MEKYNKIAVREERIEMIQKMISKKYSKEDIFELGYTEDEYSEAENQLMQLA